MSEIHPDLRKVCDLALALTVQRHTNLDFLILDGKRTKTEQEGHILNGASKTRNSRHLYGYAIDFGALVNGKLRWEPVYYKIIGGYFLEASEKLRIPIIWGGNWKWKDWGHIELSRARYPDRKELIEA
jgi:peptidoglycan L-alanyl-D-glutamate endopeptidase CwlK